MRKSAADARARTGEGRAFFTIASANYVSHAATLMQSLREHHPEAARYIVLADAWREFPGLDLAAEILPCEGLDIALLGNMRLWYTITEFNTAIKPFAFRHLLDKLGGEVCYLDPDILVFAPLAETFAALQEYTCVLTPHMMRPLQDGKEPSDLTIMKSGVYNLGFLGLRNDPDARQFLAWWSERCVAHCRIDIAGNMFTDQRWMDLAPAFLEKPFILRHPGYNVAYWNLAHRAAGKGADGRWQVDGRPLVFFHFSGIDIDQPRIVSRHQNRFTADNIGAVAELFEQYRGLVRANAWLKYRSLRYAFASFANGRPIEDPMRRWILRAVDDERLSPTEPLALHPNFFDAADETAAARGIDLTRAMYQFWLDRDDLRTVFDIYSPDGLDSYYNWFTGGDAEADGLDGRTIAAARTLRTGSGRAVAPSPHRATEPPWPPVAAESWQGAAAEAIELLRSDLAFTIDNARVLLPRQAALIWELRADLRAVYRLADLDSVNEYLAWALTSGMAEQALEPQLLTGEFVAQLARISRISLYYNDVPLTEAMLITRGVGVGRDYLDGWQRFPADRPGRLAHGLWSCFVAPKLFRWPAGLIEPTRRYFAELTDVACPGFRLNRAEMAIWELRSDLQRSFPLSEPNSCWRFLHWLVLDGLRELKLSLDEFDPRLRPFLTRESPRLPGVPQILEMIRESRVDLQNAFDTGTEAGRQALLAWGRNHFRQTYAGTAAETLYPPEPEPASLDPDAAPPARPLHYASIGLTGQWSAPSGRGEDLRMAAEALQAAGFTDFLVIDRDGGRVLRPDGSALPEGSRVELGVNIVYLNADTAFRDWRFLREAGIGARKSIALWAWELERLPRSWLHAFSFYDEIWAGTEFARAAFAREGLRPVRLVPMAVSLPRLERQPSRAELGLPADATVFLFMFDFRSYASRKNPEAVVQAFLRAFPEGTEKVRLLIKTQAGATAPDAWWSLNEMCSDPRIEVRDAKLGREDLLALIDGADAFVSLHRSEGFGRGPAEAMLLGKPVILTGYSGTADFAAPDCAYVVGYTPRPVGPDEYPGVDGPAGSISWADPDLDEAAAHMRRVHQHPKAARALGLRGRARIQEKYGPQTVGALMLQALGLTPRRPRRPAPARDEAVAPAPEPAAKSVRRPRRKRPILQIVPSAESIE